jgi:hypothetical protein
VRLIEDKSFAHAPTLARLVQSPPTFAGTAF